MLSFFAGLLLGVVLGILCVVFTGDCIRKAR